MIRFLFKGLVRDRSRFLFPVIIVTLGALLTVTMYAWMNAMMSDFLRSSAIFSTGHLRVITRGYAAEEDQLPNDLALLDVDGLRKQLQESYPGMDWVPRIHFGGLLDVPDAAGETRTQGATVGMAVDMVAGRGGQELTRLGIARALVRGRMPAKPFEMLISDDFARKLGVAPGDQATLIGSTANGSLALQNLTISGTLRFGLPPMDRMAIIIDIADAQVILDMENSASELLGYFAGDLYDDTRATDYAERFNRTYTGHHDDQDPLMMTLRQQNGLDDYFKLMDSFGGMMVAVFVAAMSIVLWNAGLLGGLRRYNEIGLRLAIGEPHGHIYRSMIIESLFIGLMGSVLGTALGLGLVYYFQIHGIDISSFMKNSSLMLSNVVRTEVTIHTFYIGFIPGLFATVLGTLLAGVGIYRRRTATLFKEMEA